MISRTDEQGLILRLKSLDQTKAKVEATSDYIKIICFDFGTIQTCLALYSEYGGQYFSRKVLIENRITKSILRLSKKKMDDCYLALSSFNKLFTSKLQLISTLESPGALIQVASGRLVACNKRWAEISQISGDQVVQRIVPSNWMRPETRELLENLYQEKGSFEQRYEAFWGQQIWLSVLNQMSRFEDAPGEFYSLNILKEWEEKPIPEDVKFRPPMP